MIVMNIMQMSIEGAMLIIVVFTIRFMTLYRLPKVTFLVMWAMILVRLFLPFSIPVHYSFFNVIDHGSWLQSQQTAFVAPHISVLPSMLQIGVQNRIKEPFAGIEQDLIVQIEPLTIIWGVGFLLFTMYFFRKYLHTIRELRLAQPIHTNPIIQDWQKKHPLKRKLTILQLDKISTPLTAGIIRPCIILPKGLDLSDQEHLNYILTHEYYHICGFHLLWKYLTIAAICIHWFNPLLWLMLITLNRDLEIACDERLLCHLGADKKVPYSYALIRMAELRSGLTLFSNGFGKNATEERIKAIMKHNENLIRIDLKYPHPLRCEYTLLDNGQVLVTMINDNRSTYIEVAKEIKDRQIYVER